MRALDAKYDTLISELDKILDQIRLAENTSAYCNYLLHALNLIGRSTRRHLVFVIRHFDIVLRHLEPTLMADIRNLHRSRTWQPIFVIATNDSLPQLAAAVNNTDLYNFSEVVGPPRWINSLTVDDLKQFLNGPTHELDLDNQELEVIHRISGGWPSIALACAHDLRSGKWYQKVMPEQSILEHCLHTDNVHAACASLWADLSVNEQETLVEIVTGHIPDSPPTIRRIENKSIIYATPNITLRSTLFSRFIHTYHLHVAKHTKMATTLLIDDVHRTVTIDGRVLRAGPDLSRLEYKLLVYLSARPNEVCSVDDILDYVYDDEKGEIGGDARIRRLVARLRAKIEPDPRNPTYIQSVRGQGICLNLPH
jgi:DNA-binding winged helix-turn-helix (wHTH) protein